MDLPARFFATRAELRDWFESHHTEAPELWVGFYKVHTGKKGVVYTEAVEEALCYGWVDTTVRRIDDERYANRFARRRTGSHWTEENRRKFVELERAGRIRDSGRRAFESRFGASVRRTAPHSLPAPDGAAPRSKRGRTPQSRRSASGRQRRAGSR